MKQTILYLRVIFHLQEISNRFKRKPPRRGQPPYKGQLACPHCVLCSEVLLYISNLVHRKIGERFGLGMWLITSANRHTYVLQQG